MYIYMYLINLFIYIYVVGHTSELFYFSEFVFGRVVADVAYTTMPHRGESGSLSLLCWWRSRPYKNNMKEQLNTYIYIYTSFAEDHTTIEQIDNIDK